MFSEEFLNNPWIVVILFGTFAWILVAFRIQRKIGQREHRYDERYEYETNRVKSKAWDIMLLVMLVAMPVVIIFDGVSFSYFLLMILYTIHCLSMGIVAIYYRMTS
ncbi:DUF3796 domain-containing protein [Ornithinibacillus xuwenensis]|uniref:DUF3796 domain-containing protein n=1 Tax=Ornithinibacillus xuwenensis TaxID=3144668 RepID=A0ABU9XHK8_9BACI